MYLLSSSTTSIVKNTDQDRLIRFGVFEVNPRTGELRKNGFNVKLQEQPLQVLLAVLQKPGDVVTREELRAKLWPADTFVDFDHGLNAAVKRLRDALDDSAESPRFIETLPRHGYRFIAAMVPDVIQTGKHSSLRRWGLPVAAAVIFIAAVLFVVNAGELRKKFFSRTVAQPQVRSLAVLPLTNLSGDPQQEYFADGMTEELITELSRIASLKVISRTSVMLYKGQKKSLPQIGRELNVDAIMQGSVLRFGNRVRIAAQLIYAPTDQHLWVETYERDLGDILKLQGEVAEAITQQIRLKLTPQELARLRTVRQVDPQAFQFYLMGLSLDPTGQREINKALGYFKKAIEKDPGFADAYLGLAHSYNDLGDNRWLRPRDAFEPSKQASRKALELDENNCRAHAILGWLNFRYDWDWQNGEKEFQRAIELCPNDARIRWQHAAYTTWMGQGARALADIEKTREIDPFWESFLRYQLLIHYQLRNYKAMIEVSQPYMALDKNNWVSHYWLGVGYEGSDQTLQAIPEYQKAVELSQRDSDPIAALGHAYAGTGKSAEARKILQEWKRQSETSYVSSYMVATVYAGLGEKDKAFEYLEKAYEERSSDLPYFLKADLRVDNLRSDSRFQDLMRRMNFPK